MNRRGLITGVLGLIAAPAIVRAGSLMPVRVPPLIIGVDFGWPARTRWFNFVTGEPFSPPAAWFAGQQWGHDVIARLSGVEHLPINRLRVHST